MILGIVGSEAAKFSEEGMWNAKHAIHSLILEYEPRAVSSGHCHLGGIDIWAEEIGEEYGVYDPRYIFKPRTLNWDGFQVRNMQIAAASQVVVCITVDKYLVGYKGSRLGFCYHCKESGHVKSGGCWTTKFARTRLNRVTRTIVVRN